ncbi:MAG TPA: SGNH/GDSL hydrolase family protein [Gemmatimonadaceae bacterium]|nr:SGNH/GDSL hydrolase family protein [Gemmatimonadaceae bacterium]
MISWSQASWGGRLKLVMFSLIPVFILLILAQVYAYLTIERTISQTADPVTGQQYYSMTIGKWPWSHKSYTPINSLGLPDQEFVGLVPKGSCIHVLLAGDSYTFGDATSAVYRWGTLLQGMTERRINNRCIRFFNIGVRNSTIDTTIVRIHQVLPLIQPDVVVLSQYQNDLTDLANPGSPAWIPAGNGRRYDSHWGERLARVVPGYNLSLERYLTYNAFAFMIEHNIKYDVLSTWSVLETSTKHDWAMKLEGIYHDLYGSLVKDMRSRNIQFVALGFPSKMDVLAKRSPEGDFWASLAKEYNVPYLSLMPTLDAHRSTMPFHLYDGHMNEYGNSICADAIWKWLFTSHPAPAPTLQDAAEISMHTSSATSATW